MKRPKNHNSILVLATLGVYLGLVLVGATPQVLAQAAMTREFNVKDEIEVKDDLDTKPESSEAPDTESTAATANKIAKSVQRFLCQFNSAAGDASILVSSARSFDFGELRATFNSDVRSLNAEPFRRLDSILSPADLPRAGLDALLANDAK